MNYSTSSSTKFKTKKEKKQLEESKRLLSPPRTNSSSYVLSDVSNDNE